MFSFGMGMDLLVPEVISDSDLDLLNSQLLPYYARCFVGKVWSTWGASP